MIQPISGAQSHDGRKIAFVSATDGNDQIYVMNADGSGQTRLTNDRFDDWAPSWSPDDRKILFTSNRIGLASILLQTALLMSLVLLLVRRWKLPFGSLTLMFTLSSALISVINDHYLLILVALGAGLISDLLLWWLKPSSTQPGAFRIFAFLVPLAFYGLYFLALFLTKGIGWSVHLWMGSIVTAGVVGLLLSYLLIPPLASAE